MQIQQGRRIKEKQSIQTVSGGIGSHGNVILLVVIIVLPRSYHSLLLGSTLVVLLVYPEAYSESCRTPKMQLFAKTFKIL